MKQATRKIYSFIFVRVYIVALGYRLVEESGKFMKFCQKSTSLKEINAKSWAYREKTFWVVFCLLFFYNDFFLSSLRHHPAFAVKKLYFFSFCIQLYIAQLYNFNIFSCVVRCIVSIHHQQMKKIIWLKNNRIFFFSWTGFRWLISFN